MATKRKYNDAAHDLNNDGNLSIWEIFPYWFDKLRIFPRAFISMYIYLL